MKAEYFAPEPTDLLESNRNLGYSFEEAIADLIDNSITADSKNIFIECRFNKGEPFLSILDDGIGMDEMELVKSFKLGSNIPESQRSTNDLGRFGMGMKTASLSQSRCLHVVSKASDRYANGRSLDLDFIRENGWYLKKNDFARIIGKYNLDSYKSGTLIYWAKWDRAPKKEYLFNSLAKKLRDYLGLCFNKFISRGSLSITVNEVSVKAISPIPLDSEHYSGPRHGPSGSELNGYLLKHPLKWDNNIDYTTSFNSYNLFNGIDAHQGIYIYRCNRLLTPYGGWLGLIKPLTATKLARVEIEYPNSADELWSLDITKTKARIPEEFQEEIKRLIKATRVQSLTKIGRGKRNIRIKTPERTGRVWLSSENKELMCYVFQPNINHHVFQQMIKENRISEKDLKYIFKLIANNLPVSEIVNMNDDDSFKVSRMNYIKELESYEKDLVTVIYNKFRSEGKSHTEALEILFQCEPYCYHKDRISELIQKTHQ